MSALEHFPSPLVERARARLGERRGYEKRYESWVVRQAEYMLYRPFAVEVRGYSIDWSHLIDEASLEAAVSVGKQATGPGARMGFRFFRVVDSRTGLVVYPGRDGDGGVGEADGRVSAESHARVHEDGGRDR